MKRMTIHQRVAGTYTLLVHDGDRVSEWRTGIPTADEAKARARYVCDLLGYRLDTRIRVASAARPSPRPKETTMGTTSKAAPVTEAAKARNISEIEVPAGVEKGATVRVLVDKLKDKRRDQLAHVSDEPGRVVRILNGRAWVEFGNEERWWVRVDHLEPATAQHVTVSSNAEAVTTTVSGNDTPDPAEAEKARKVAKAAKERERYHRLKAEREAAKASA